MVLGLVLGILFLFLVLFLLLLFLLLLFLSDSLHGVFKVPGGVSVAGPLAQRSLERVGGLSEVCGRLLVLLLLRDRVSFSCVGDAEVVVGVRPCGRGCLGIGRGEKRFLRLLAKVLREQSEAAVELHGPCFRELSCRLVVRLQRGAVLFLGHQRVALLGVGVFPTQRAPGGRARRHCEAGQEA